MPPATVRALAYDWNIWARDNQLPPAGKWFVWLLLAGRGFGKTRTGGEWVHERVRAGARRIALVAPTAADVRDTMVEGPAGLLAKARPGEVPRYEPSKRRVTWPNGAVALCFSADAPERLRGPQHDTAWCDELAAWRYPDATWSNLLFGLRLGDDPRVCVTTTPRPVPLVRELLAAPDTAVTRGSTFDNAANLAPQTLAKIRRQYEGTRLGLQELFAQLLDDTPGALWTLDNIHGARVPTHPPLRRAAVAVDPAASSTAASDETGIVGGGVDAVGEGFVLADRSLKGSPEEWGQAAVLLHDQLEADFIVAEKNNGGDMVASVIRAAAAELHRKNKRPHPQVTVRLVHASRGKRPRAEPVAQLYEQRRVHHVGTLATLEDQMTTWDASDPAADSPDRVDALVWLLSELMVNKPVTTGTTHHAPPARPAFAPRR